MRALLVGNVGDGDPGLVGARFEHHGYAFERVDRDHPETWPTLDGAELIVLLGSEWSVYWPDIVEAVEAEAAAILKHLSGRAHRVLTAVAIARGDTIEHALSISEVRFRVLGDDEIRRYVRSGEPLDKAGAYGIQGHAAIFVASIAGSHSGIVGLPLCETALLLRQFGYPV